MMIKVPMLRAGPHKLMICLKAGMDLPPSLKETLAAVELEKLIKEATLDLQQKPNVLFSSPPGVQTPIKNRLNRIAISK